MQINISADKQRRREQQEIDRQEALEIVRMLSSNFTNIGIDIGELVTEKNQAYGDSFNQSEKIIAVLYPNGVPPNGYTDFLTIIRVIDKLFRIATDRDALGESPWRDIAGYSLLAIERQLRDSQKVDEQFKPQSPKISVVEKDHSVCQETEHDIDKVTRMNKLAALLKEKVEKETNARLSEQDRQNEIDSIAKTLVDEMDLEQIAHP